MKLPESLVNDFAKLVASNNARDTNRSTFVYGTAQVANDDSVSVIFDGADEPTPVSTTVGVKTGDRVLVLIRNHSATVMSNITSPVATFEAITSKYADLGGFVSVANDTGCYSKTSANGGHRYPTSLYKHGDDGTYEYEVGMKGDGEPGNLAFYIKRITKGDAWHEVVNGQIVNSETDMFYIRHNGYLFARNADITGKITATSGSFKGSIDADAFKATYSDSNLTMTAQLTGGGLYITSNLISPSTKRYLLLDPSTTIWRNTTTDTGQCAYVTSRGFAISDNGVKGDGYARVNILTTEISQYDAAGTHGTYIHNASVDVVNGTTDGRSGRFTSSDAGNVGLYDPDEENYIIYSASDFTVHVPHKLYTHNMEGTTKRVPVGSSQTANQGVSWLGCTATATLSIRGQWNANSWGTKTVAVSSSDARLKRDISDTKVKALDVISRIRMREFTWKEDDVFQPLGVIADELEKIDPMFVVGGGEDENGDPIYKSINTLYLLAYCVKAIQELKGDHDDGR